MIMALYASVALPCGPNLPDALLAADTDRLASAPVPGFAAELDRLLPDRPHPKRWIGNALSTWEVDAVELRAAAPPSVDLGPYLDQRRAWESGSNPWSTEPPAPFPRLPGGLPAEFGLYNEGAAAWHRGDEDGARRAFQAVLDLPADQRQRRALWATWMLGRIAERRGEEGAATARYAEVRALADQGAPDPLGLATASLGREGGIALSHGRYSAAIQYYLDEQAYGGPGALQSLRIVATRIAADAARGDDSAGADMLAPIAADPEAAKVLTAWLVAHSGPDATVNADAEHSFAPTDVARRWQIAVQRAHAEAAVGADHLAWMAYQRGEWSEAARWVVGAGDTPVAHWIRAKLALREGRTPDAERELTLAAQGFPKEESWPLGWWERDPFGDGLCPAQASAAEAGVLRTNLGRYREALDAFYEGRDWLDAAYLAERVMTTDELRAWVDATPVPPAPPVAPRAAPDLTAIPVPSSPIWDTSEWNWVMNLRALLARRLVREGRFGEARGYLPESSRAKLDDYAHALNLGRARSLPSPDRAKALWIAAHIARRDGPELLAYELEPDFMVWFGDYQTPVVDTRIRMPVSPDELARVAATQPAAPGRWSYRYVAADLAWESAALLPKDDDHRVRALCAGGAWLQNSDPAYADRFYKEMVRNWNHPLARAADAYRWFPDCGPPWPDEALPTSSAWCATVTAVPAGSLALLGLSALRSRRRRRDA